MRSIRKKRNDIEYANSGGVTYLLDNLFKSMWQVNDKELDFIFEFATNEELDIIMLDEKTTFSQAKLCLITIDKILERL